MYRRCIQSTLFTKRSVTSLTDNDAVVVSYSRTPIGKMGGCFVDISAPKLAGFAIRSAVERANGTSLNGCFNANNVEEIIIGNVVSSGIGQAPGKQAVIYGGLPNHIPVTDVNKVCASGMKAVMFAAMSIQSGYRNCVLAGGMESMSNIPYYLPPSTRFTGYKLGHTTLTDGLLKDGLWDPYNDVHMGTCGDICAKSMGISRESQDAFALRSYALAAAAWNTPVIYLYGSIIYFNIYLDFHY